MDNILTKKNQQIIRKIITTSTYTSGQSCLLFGVTTDDRIRDEVEKQVREGLKQKRAVEFLDIGEYQGKKYNDFFPRLRELSQNNPYFIFVRGLDELIAYDIFHDRMLGERPLILNYLNMNREFFQENPVHILFWISPETEKMLFNLSPDFWSFRTHSYFFDEIIREELPDLSCLKIIELVPYEGNRKDLYRDIDIKEELLAKFLVKDDTKLSYQSAGLLKELSIRYYLKRDYKKAQEYAIKVFRENKEGEKDPELLNIMGLCNGKSGELNEAQKFLQKALSVTDEKNIYKGWKSVLLNNLGVVFYWMEDWKKAESYFRKALENTEYRNEDNEESYNESRDKYNRIFILSNQGTVLFREIELNEAGDCYYNSLITLIKKEPTLLLPFFRKFDGQFPKEIILWILRNIGSYLGMLFNEIMNYEIPFVSFSMTADFFFNWGVFSYSKGNLGLSEKMLSLSIKFYNFDGENKCVKEVLNWMLRRKNWKHLELNLNLSGLDYFPQEICEMEELKGLYLQSNHLSCLPDKLKQLKNLQYLYLDNNNFSLFPYIIARLNNLKELLIGQNSISVLPPEIGKMLCLEELVLDENQLVSIPPEIGNLINLRSLNLRENEISKVPPKIGNLENLEKLDLSYNHISALPFEFRNLKKLRYLFLQGNNLPLPYRILHKTNSPSEILDYYFNNSEVEGYNRQENNKS